MKLLSCFHKKKHLPGMWHMRKRKLIIYAYISFQTVYNTYFSNINMQKPNNTSTSPLDHLQNSRSAPAIGRGCRFGFGRKSESSTSMFFWGFFIVLFFFWFFIVNYFLFFGFFHVFLGFSYVFKDAFGGSTSRPNLEKMSYVGKTRLFVLQLLAIDIRKRRPR